MLDDFQLASILPFITLVTVVVTVVVGVLGLRQGYYRSGKLTRRGRHMVAGLVMLGLATLVSGIVDRRLSAEKDREEAQSRTRQFTRQMSSLLTMQRTLGDSIRRQERLTENLRAVQSTLDVSIQRQQALAGLTAENLRMNRVLETQSRRNTRTLLRRVFDEANRVSLENAQVSVSPLCDESFRPSDRPALAERITFRVVGPQGEGFFWSSTPIHTYTGTEFRRFRGRLGSYLTFAAWRNASVRVFLSARDLGLLPPDPNDPPGLPPPASDGYRLVGCHMIITLAFDERVLISTVGDLTPSREGEFEAILSDVRVDATALPNFNADHE